MVRINLINPKNLSDQHLIAEYNEILMLLGHLKKHGVNKNKIPKQYVLGKGHINFFKNKLKYLKQRHELIKKEMRARGFATNKSISLKNFDKELHNYWSPSERDLKVIKSRLTEKILLKPEYYRHNRSKISTKELIKKIKHSD